MDNNSGNFLLHDLLVTMSSVTWCCRLTQTYKLAAVSAFAEVRVPQVILQILGKDGAEELRPFATSGGFSLEGHLLLLAGEHLSHRVEGSLHCEERIGDSDVVIIK